MIALDSQIKHQLENIAQQTQQSVQQLIQSFITDYQQKQPNQETITAIEAVERGEVETTSIEELRKLAQI